MKRIISVAAIASVAVLAGCSTTAIKMGQFQPVSLQTAAIMPSKAQLSGAPLKVVVFPLNEKNMRMATRAHVGRTIADTIDSYLSKSGVELLDRSIYGKLKQEIALAEMKGTSGYEGPREADFAIAGDISEADYSHSFTEASYWRDNNGVLHVTPASCLFKAEVTGNVHIYQLPSLQLVKSIAIEGEHTHSRQTRDSECLLSREERSSFVREAAAMAVQKSRTTLQNFFSPRGYVLERRDNNSNNTSIFEISLGTQRGAKPGAQCDFYQTIADKNPLTGKTTNDQYEIGNGTVTNQLGPNYAWVLVGDPKVAGKVRLGDEVKFHYAAGFFEKLNDMMN